MDLKVNNYNLNNYQRKSNIGFGTIIPIQKVFKDGVEVKGYDVVWPIHGFVGVLLKKIDYPKGEAIRGAMAKMANDYQVPKMRVQEPKEFTVGVGSDLDDNYYLLTGKDYLTDREEMKKAFSMPTNSAAFDKDAFLSSIRLIKNKLKENAEKNKGLIIHSAASNEEGSIFGTKFIDAEFIG